MKDWLIVSDLDGSLLDDDYPVAEAARQIDVIVETHPNVRVALASSKTLTEMIKLAAHCESDPLLIFENGAGLAWRDPALHRRGAWREAGYEVECLASDYADIRKTLAELARRPGFDFRGFGDMSPSEVAERTGLDEASAADAQRRVASEPILWLGDAAGLTRFREALEELGFTLELGGRFHHVSSSPGKGRAMIRLQRMIRYHTGVRVTTLACGDAPNDMDMLQRADHALVFPDRHGNHLLSASDSVLHAPRAGPTAWLAGVLRVFATQTLTALKGT